MKFSVSQSSLATALSIVGKGMSGNSTIPLLSGIYIKADNGMLEFQTNNLTISIRHKITANVEEPGEVVVSGKLLTGIVKNLPDAAVTFEGGERTLTITCLSSLFRLNTLDAKDWSEFPGVAFASACELPSEILSEMANKVYKVTSKENSRPILQGVLLSAHDNTLRLVATDSYRLAMCETYAASESTVDDFSLIIPGTVFHDVLHSCHLRGIRNCRRGCGRCLCSCLTAGCNQQHRDQEQRDIFPEGFHHPSFAMASAVCCTNIC